VARSFNTHFFLVGVTRERRFDSLRPTRRQRKWIESSGSIAPTQEKNRGFAAFLQAIRFSFIAERLGKMRNGMLSFRGGLSGTSRSVERENGIDTLEEEHR
jgi:hypothetical protein